MAYTTNPKLPRLRAKAVEEVRQGKSVTEVARYYGYTKGAVSKWCKRAPVCRTWEIPTRSSRPKHHPNETSPEIVRKIIATKVKYNRCAEVVHEHLKRDGVSVCLNTVKRKLDYAGLTKKRSPWKRLHLSTERPNAVKPGDLVTVDTIHLMVNPSTRIYVYTLIDVYSRWCFAKAYTRANTRISTKFLAQAQEKSPFAFNCIQSDHGSEFSQHFSERIKIVHRHSRVRRPNDNAHLERFNRTLQDECLKTLPVDVKVLNRHIRPYLHYYNTERLHLGLNLQTPQEILQKCFQAIG